MFETFYLLIVLIHLFLSYLILGGFPIMLVTSWLGGKERNSKLNDLAQKMGGVGPVLAMLALILGFVLGLSLFGMDERPRIPGASSFWLGYVLLSFFLLITVGGIFAYKRIMSDNTSNSSIPGMMAGGIMISLLGITLLFGVWHIMMLNPDYVEYVMKKGMLGSLNLPAVWPRFAHIVLGSVAATGIFMTLYGTFQPFSLQITRYGVGWTLAGTLPQIVVGPWLLISLPDEVRMRLVDGNSVGSLVFFSSLTLALFALVLLNASLMVPHVRGLVWSGLGSLFLTIVLMVLVREEVRQTWLDTSGNMETLGTLSVGVALTVITASLLGFLGFGRWVKRLSLSP